MKKGVIARDTDVEYYNILLLKGRRLDVFVLRFYI